MCKLVFFFIHFQVHFGYVIEYDSVQTVFPIEPKLSRYVIDKLVLLHLGKIAFDWQSKNRLELWISYKISVFSGILQLLSNLNWRS